MRIDDIMLKIAYACQFAILSCNIYDFSKPNSRITTDIVNWNEKNTDIEISIKAINEKEDTIIDTLTLSIYRDKILFNFDRYNYTLDKREDVRVLQKYFKHLLVDVINEIMNNY